MSRLEFKTVRIKDYRQYGGEQEIDLSTSDSRINIIEGQNGAGKSNLLNAITLCFYGEERHQDDSDEDLESLPLVTRSQLNHVHEGESHTGFIEVELGTEHPGYVFRREFSTYNVGNEFTNQIGDLTLQRRFGQEWKSPDNPQTHLNQVLPATVSDYFLFDGEDLDAFFEEGYTNRVQNAILDVSHIQLLNVALDHLDKVESDIERTAGNLEGEAGKLRDEKGELESDLKSKEDELENVRANISDIDTEIKRIDNKLRDASNERVRKLYDRREKLNEEIEQHSGEIEEQRKKTVDLMIDAGPVVYSAEALKYTIEKFDDLADKGQLPPKIQDWFIDELIERGTCICGTDLTENPEHVEELRDVQSDVSEVLEENLEGKSEIPSMLEVTESKVEQIRERRKRIANLRDKNDKKNREIQNIKDELKGRNLPDEDEIDINALEDQRETLEERRANLQKKKGRVQKEIEDIEEEISSVETKLRRELEKQSRYEEIVTQLNFTEKAETHLRTIKEEILSEIRQSTEANLEQYFNELIWKDENYELVLNDDYSIEVLDPHGDNKIGSLSAGEKQVLALSFMAALTQISGFDAPILIDTPLGRISSDPKKQIAQNLPRYVEDTQITFLMTDEEYTEDVRGIMKGSLANEYKLSYKDTVTKVETYV